MIVPAEQAHFAALVAGERPHPWRLAPGEPIAPAEVLAMLGELADTIRPQFDPAAWLVIEDGEVVGLISLVVPPAQGTIRIGYGVAAGRAGQGVATRAVGDLLDWARADHRVDRVTAETGHHNIASHRVLERNGFVRIGTRFDAEDGHLIVWDAPFA